MNRRTFVLTALFLILCLLFSLTACQREAAPPECTPTQDAQGAQCPAVPIDEEEAIPEEEQPPRIDDQNEPDESEDDELEYNEEEPGWAVWYDEEAMAALGWSEVPAEGDCVLHLKNGETDSLQVFVRWIGSLTVEAYLDQQREAFFADHPQGAEQEAPWETPWGYEGCVLTDAGVQYRCCYLEGFGIEILLTAEEGDLSETADCFFSEAFDMYAAG